MLVKITKIIDIYVKPIKKILTISSFRGLKRPHSCEIGLTWLYMYLKGTWIHMYARAGRSPTFQDPATPLDGLPGTQVSISSLEEVLTSPLTWTRTHQSH